MRDTRIKLHPLVFQGIAHFGKNQSRDEKCKFKNAWGCHLFVLLLTLTKKIVFFQVWKVGIFHDSETKRTRIFFYNVIFKTIT